MDDKVFNLLEKMYADLTSKIDGLGSEIKEVKQEVKKNSEDISKTNVILENDFKPKIEALFDGYKQNTKLLEDIREEVAKHEEVIIKRVK
jgi:peptidoglycan hydrolase CwlO-like protein